MELLLKVALRLVGIEPPKWFDVDSVLIKFQDKFPEWFRQAIPELAAISRWLRREKRGAWYTTNTAIYRTLCEEGA